MNDKLVAVLYMQRISAIDAVDSQRFMQISEAHDPAGSIIQLIAIAVDPEVGSMGIGSDLRAFALHLARLDPTVETVVGVTRCRDFQGHGGSMQSYVDDHVAGKLADPIVDFHTSYGAEVVRLVPNFRPEDTANDGVGVLIQYNVKELALSARRAGSVEGEGTASVVPTLEVLSGIMDELDYPLDRSDLHKGFFDYGMDSLELVRVRNKLSSSLAMDLPATLLLDFPTVQDLADQLDRDRGIGPDTLELRDQDEDDQDDEAEMTSGWEGVTPSELLELQKRSKKIYQEAGYQKRFHDMARKCYPDMMRYILAIETILVEVEGPLMLEYGLIDSLDWQSVQIGRSHLTATQMKYWRDYPEVKAMMDEIMHVTKQDQYWK